MIVLASLTNPPILKGSFGLINFLFQEFCIASVHGQLSYQDFAARSAGSVAFVAS
jgi:hypothetical protein